MVSACLNKLFQSFLFTTVALELWWDIKLFKKIAVQDPPKSKTCALEILSLYLLPHSEKLIFPLSVRSKPELQRVCEPSLVFFIAAMR
jgi:hypothetical protein